MMLQACDEEALGYLLKAPKKKYLKKLVEFGIMINLSHNRLPAGFENPISQNFQTDFGLSYQQANRLLLAISKFVDNSYMINFQYDKQQIFGPQFDDQLKELLCEIVLNNREAIQEGKRSQIKQGKRLVDINWKVDMQIATQQGKSNIPCVLLDIDSVGSSAELQTHSVIMQGQKFQAFFGNLTKIKDQLNDLIK